MPRYQNNKRPNKSRKRKARPRRRRVPMNDNRLQITNIENKPILTRSVRYQSALSGTNTMTFYSNDLLSMFVYATSGSTASTSLFDSVLINCISISAYQTSGQIESVAFKWESTNAPESQSTLITQSAIMARGTYHPPPDSSASWWMNTAVTSYELFAITPSATSLDIILDINFRYVMADGATLPQTLNGAATFTGVGVRNMPASTGSGLRQFVGVGVSTVA